MNGRTTILHVDMDAFFAAVTLRDKPALHGLPVVVGGRGRGVVLCATYPARAAGVHSGMSTAEAQRRCPQLVVVPPESGRIGEVSRAVMEIFARFTPVLQPLSPDEAFLDVSGAVRLFGPPEHIGELVRARVRAEQGITCSVGVAANTRMAKLGSRLAKPDGLVVIRPDDVTRLVHPLPLDALWGIGPATAARLRRLGLETVGDIARTPASTLRHALGRTTGTAVHLWSWGHGGTVLRPREHAGVPDRSIGAEETFARDLRELRLIRRELLRLSVRVAGRARAAHVVARTVTLKVRFTDFATRTRAHTTAEPTDVAAEIHHVACDLLATFDLRGRPLRLVGVRLSGLLPADRTARQPGLGARERERYDVEHAMDRVTARFGSAAVRPASLVDTETSGDRRPHRG